MNVHDSRRIEEVLNSEGYDRAAGVEQADLIVFNTCSVREKAEQKLRSAVGTLRELKQRRPDLVIVVAGCMAQQHGEALLRRFEIVDVVIGPDNVPDLPELVARVQAGEPPMALTVLDTDRLRFLRAQPRTNPAEVVGYVTIMKGCDEHCSFCIVPYTRGFERYRPADDIIGEIEQMASGGVRQITLLGQTVNSWRDPSLPEAKGEPGFAGLLRRIAAETPGLKRLRYTAPHPRHLTDELVRAHAEIQVLPWHLHLPAQSGSDRILKLMVRRHGRDFYLQRVRALKEARPGSTLSTDLIVGFPGETEHDFQQTLSLVREAGFVNAFAFKYSPRPFTPALRLGDSVPAPVKEERLARLLELIESQQRAHLQSLVGGRVEVLLEGRNPKDPSRFTGRSQRHEIVHVQAPAGRDLTGELVEVVVEHANRHSLMGSLADERRQYSASAPAAPIGAAAS